MPALLGACGGRSVAALRAPCQPRARAAVARFAGVRAGAVRAVYSVGDNSYPQCTYTARRAQAVVNVYTGPQAYFLLERTQVEAAQNFSSAHTALTVDHVSGIGQDAYWFPSESLFMTTDGRHLLRVTVSWPGVSGTRLQAFAVAAARPYVGR